MQRKQAFDIRHRSSKREWGRIFVVSVVSVFIVIALTLRIYEDQISRPPEFNWLPFLMSSGILGAIWAIRSTFNFFVCSDTVPMSNDDHLVFEKINSDSGDLPKDRLTRWTVATLSSAGSLGFVDVQNAFWAPLILGVCAAIWAFDVVLLGLALAAIGALLWGISLLPVPLAIVLGASIIAAALYFAIVQRWRE